LVVLREIPISVAASLLVLWICGNTLNLMSAIGIHLLVREEASREIDVPIRLIFGFAADELPNIFH